MDSIKITIEREGRDDSALFIGVNISGNDLPGILNIDEFFAIKQHNGLVPLFTCGCGDFGCSGYYIDVSSTATVLILRNAYHRFRRSLQAEFEYQLDWQQIRRVAEEIISYLQNIEIDNADARVTSGYTGENLIERLTHYRESAILL